MRYDCKAPPSARVEADLRASPDLAALKEMTPAQIDAWVDAQVTTIAGARRVLKFLLRAAVVRYLR